MMATRGPVTDRNRRATLPKFSGDFHVKGYYVKTEAPNTRGHCWHPWRTVTSVPRQSKSSDGITETPQVQSWAMGGWGFVLTTDIRACHSTDVPALGQAHSPQTRRDIMDIQPPRCVLGSSNRGITEQPSDQPGNCNARDKVRVRRRASRRQMPRAPTHWHL